MNHAEIIKQFQLSDLLPHRDGMLLVQRAVSAGEKSAVCETTVDKHSLFFIPGRGVPAWVGLELMAQTVAVKAGIDARLRQQTPPVGFLLGTRKMECSKSWFEAGDVLTMEVRERSAEMHKLAIYNCSISIAEDQIATAGLMVYRRDDV